MSCPHRKVSELLALTRSTSIAPTYAPHNATCIISEHRRKHTLKHGRIGAMHTALVTSLHKQHEYYINNPHCCGYAHLHLDLELSPSLYRFDTNTTKQTQPNVHPSTGKRLSMACA
jgi:hypothetical protein